MTLWMFSTENLVDIPSVSLYNMQVNLGIANDLVAFWWKRVSYQLLDRFRFLRIAAIS